ncbi:hypothetical protein Tco_0243041 [Tanacetum coccineum]
MIAIVCNLEGCSYFGDAAPRSVVAQIQDKDEGQKLILSSREVSTVVPEVNTANPKDLVGPSHASGRHTSGGPRG